MNKPGRLDFVDSLRGVAVVLMILWHTADGWITNTVRSETLFLVLRSLGGLAAPLFVLLAGIGLGLRASSDAVRGTSASRTAMTGVARGLEIVVLGYALRYQMWLVDGGALSRPESYAGAAACALGLTALYVAAGRLTKQPRSAVMLGAGGGLAWAIGLGLVSQLGPTRFGGLLRVDVLQAIGASLVVVSTGVGLRVLAPQRAWVGVVLGLGVACATPFVEKLVPSAIPDALEAYLAQWTPPPGQRVAALFPLFPWMAYALAGWTVGVTWEGAAKRGETARVLARTGAIGLAVALITNETTPWGFVFVQQFPWLIPFVRVTYRIGVGLTVAWLAHRFTQPSRGFPPVRTLGRGSLLVYWVHLQIAYGLVSVRWQHTLGYGAWLAGFLLLTAAMYGLVVLRDGPLAAWRKARLERSAIRT